MARQATAGTPSILPKSFCSNNLRNLIHSNRRFVVQRNTVFTRFSLFHRAPSRRYDRGIMFDVIKTQLDSAGEKLTHLRRFL
jgi:hypothetical protein